MTAPLSAHLIHTGQSQSWRHALAEVSGEALPEVSPAMDLGTAFHAVLLEGVAAVEIIEAADFRTKAAREARDAARAAGRVPLLPQTFQDLQAMVTAAKLQLDALEEPMLLLPEAGIAEASIFWTEDGGIECRATPDWLSLDHRMICDLKTTSGSAHPAAFARVLWDKGYGIQEAWYRRAVKRVHGVAAEFRFIVVETFPPYALSVVSLDPEAQAFADQQVEAGLAEWRRCVETGHWPAYPARVAYAEVPPWIQAAWQTRTYYTEEMVR